MAALEYTYMKNVGMSLLDLNTKISGLGALPCFCKHNFNDGAADDQEYGFKIGNKYVEEPIC